MFKHSSSLRDKDQVEQLLRYVVEEPPEDADMKRTFKYDCIFDVLNDFGLCSS